jgi:outer membrane protein
MIKSFVFCVLVAVVSMSASVALAQTKVGIIDKQKALEGIAEMKKSLAAIKAKYEPKVAEFQKLLTEIDQLQKRRAGKLTPQEEEEVDAKLMQKTRESNQKHEAISEESEFEVDQLFAKCRPEIETIAKKLAVDKGLDVLLEASNTVWFKPALDITKEVTDAYDKAHPVAK